MPQNEHIGHTGAPKLTQDIDWIALKELERQRMSPPKLLATLPEEQETRVMSLIAIAIAILNNHGGIQFFVTESSYDSLKASQLQEQLDTPVKLAEYLDFAIDLPEDELKITTLLMMKTQLKGLLS